jgi:GDP-4-dehydro-6-deoxy-D-mannose reductase
VKILVTGAAGFVGGHLLDRLLSDGARVVGWYRPGASPATPRTDASWMSVELLDREAVAGALADVRPDAVYHLAGAAHVAESWRLTLETYQNNVLGTHYLLSALADVRPDARTLVTCSAAVYRPQDRALREDDPVAPASPYATSKLAQEILSTRVWQEQRLPVLIARSFNHTGPGQDPAYVASGIARQIARIEAGIQDPTLHMGNLEPRRDLSDVRDVVRAYAAMMADATPGRPYNICSGRELSVRTLVATFAARANRAVTVVQDPALLRPTDVPLLVGDHSRLTTDTGWTPEIPLEKTVDDLLDYWRGRVRQERADG